MVWLVDFVLVSKRWFKGEANLERFFEYGDIWFRMSGLGITKLRPNFSDYVLLLLAVLPFFYTHMFGGPYKFYRTIMLAPEESGLAAVTTTLIIISGLLTYNKIMWTAWRRREIFRVTEIAQELGSVETARSSWILGTGMTLFMWWGVTNRSFLPLMSAQSLPEENIALLGFENVNESPDYEFTYCFTILAYFTAIPAYIGFFLLYVGLIGHISSHFRLLSADFENLLHGVTRENSEVIDEELLKKKMIGLIEQHCKIISVVQNVKDLFNSILGFDFGLITLGMGVLLIQMSRSGILVWLDYLIYYVLVLYVYCYSGERLRTAAEALPDSVWCSGWEVFRPRERRSVLMVLRSAQKRQNLTAGTFVTVTYQSLMKIVKTCFSIYAAFDAAKGV